MTKGSLDINLIRAARGLRRIGQRIEYLAETTSTNDAAWLRVHGERWDGLVIFSESQTAGRGRRGRAWHSPRGASLLLSIGISGQNNPLAGEWISIMTALAVHDTVAHFSETVPQIKWPNDVLVNGRKISGILVESRQNNDGTRDHVVGIGINCLQHLGHFSEPLDVTATSLDMLSNEPIDRTKVAIHLLQALDQRFMCPELLNPHTLRSQWLARSSILGSRVTLECNEVRLSGTVIDLDPTAALVLQLDEGGIRAFNAFDTSLVSMGYNS